jgi:hypothetical protein
MANDNGWGDGVLNNTIGWGQGSDNNTIGWGSVYGDSEAGLTALESAGGAPVNTLAPVISGTAERGETLTSNTGTWTGVGVITYAYQWKRDGSNISGAISSTYVLVIADDNTNITCLVTATDDVGSSSQLSNSLGPVLGSPYLLSAPVASGTAQVGETLSTTNGTWQGVATITFTYQWRRDAVNISGATSSTYVLVAADYTTDVDCVVTAANALGSANQDTNDISNIAGTIPVISGVPSISAETQVGETITATAASATGDPTPTTSWTWQRSADGSTGWANIIGATSITYTLVEADDANYVRAVQTETNASGSDSANSLASAQITPSVDPDAQAYITAANITDPTEQAAVIQLVLDLKGTGSTTNNTDVWSDSYTLYPLSPTSLTAAEYNLKDPTQNITWLNSPTHATTGITGNGTNAYGDTNWNPTTEGVDIYNTGLTYSGEYSNSDYAMGVLQASRYMALRNNNSTRIAYIGTSGSAVSFANTTRLVTTSSRTDKFLNQIYKNGVFESQNTTSAGSTNLAPNANVFILALSNSGVLTAPFAGEIDFVAVHKGLSANQVQDLSDAITTYNTAVR